jgi:hypothetical protein
VVDTSVLLTPFLAFCGALLAVLVALRGARQLERRSVREETMRNLRWASELGVSDDPRLVKLGALQLEALSRQPQLDDYELVMVMAAVDSMEAPDMTEVG